MKTKRLTLRTLVRRRLLSGLLVIVPLGLTVFILRFIYDLTVGRLDPVIKTIFDPLPGFVVPVVSLSLLLAATYFIGLAASVVIGRKIIALAEAVLDKIPLVKMIYGASKQVMRSLSLDEDGSRFNSVVLVDFPMPGMKSFAFVTGTVKFHDSVSGTVREHYLTFIPTTPNPTSGYLEFVPVEEADDPGISTEDALKAVMSAGLVMPQQLGLAASLSPPPRNPIRTDAQ